MNKKNNRKGFTIVELVIVIAVIAILATVLVPTFGGVINNANKAKVQQELKNAYTSYTIDQKTAGTVIIKLGTNFYSIEDGAVAADEAPVAEPTSGKYWDADAGVMVDLDATTPTTPATT